MTTNSDGGERVARGEGRTLVLRTLTDRPGQLVYVDDIVNATGLTSRQVQGAINAARAASDTLATEIEVIIRGNAWRWRPRPTALATPPPSSTPEKPVKAPRATTERRSAVHASTTTVATTSDDVNLETLYVTADGVLILRNAVGDLFEARRIR